MKTVDISKYSLTELIELYQAIGEIIEKESKDESGMKLMQSRFKGECSVCKQQYSKGDMIFWKKGETHHLNCHKVGQT